MKKINFKRERRQFLRVGTYHLAKYLRVGTQEGAYPILSISRNIGGGGLMLITSQRLEVGDKIEIELNFPPFDQPVKAIAQVMYIKKKDKSNKWQAGVRFLELGDQARERISGYIDYINKTGQNQKKA